MEKENHLLAEKENTSDRLLSFRPKNDQNAMVVPNKFKWAQTKSQMYIQSTLLFGDIAPLGQYIRVRNTIDRRNDQILGVGLILIFKATKAILSFYRTQGQSLPGIDSDWLTGLGKPMPKKVLFNWNSGAGGMRDWKPFTNGMWQFYCEYA